LCGEHEERDFFFKRGGDIAWKQKKPYEAGKPKRRDPSLTGS